MADYDPDRDLQVLHGDCLQVLEDLPANHVHAVVTDPPYGLAFMGRDWDDFSPRDYQGFSENWARRAYRVLKPGGHLLAFSGNRTHHRMMTGLEDAGFTVRDTITWHYGSGFPKGKSVDDALDDVAPDQADDWAGWNTTLKPATEFIAVCRKPIDRDSVARNHLAHGTGALNVGACRVGTEHRVNQPTGTDANVYADIDVDAQEPEEVEGRWPANVVLDPVTERVLDEQTGDVSGGDTRGQCDGQRPGGFADVGADSGDPEPNSQVYADTGGASRFYYTAKATKAERTMNGRIDNPHPTVKPQDLIAWLTRLVTADGHRVLDPFAGSGTGGVAAKDLGRRWVGVERNPDWVSVAQARIGVTPDDPSALLKDARQSGLTDFAGDAGGQDQGDSQAATDGGEPDGGQG